MFTAEEVGRAVEIAWFNLFVAAGVTCYLTKGSGPLDKKGIDLVCIIEGKVKVFQIKCNPIDAKKHLEDGVYLFDGRMVATIVGAPHPSDTDIHSVLRDLEKTSISVGVPVSPWNDKQVKAMNDCKTFVAEHSAWNPDQEWMNNMMKREVKF